MFRHYTATAAISRKGTTTDSGFKKSGFSDIGKCYSGHLKAQSLRDVVDTSAFGREFTFTTAADADIQEGDRLTIDGTNYDVTGFAKFRGISFETRQVLLTVSKNEPRD